MNLLAGFSKFRSWCNSKAIPRLTFTKKTLISAQPDESASLNFIKINRAIKIQLDFRALLRRTTHRSRPLHFRKIRQETTKPSLVALIIRQTLMQYLKSSRGSQRLEPVDSEKLLRKCKIILNVRTLMNHQIKKVFHDQSRGLFPERKDL